MFDLIVYAIPAFVLLLAVEFFSFRLAHTELTPVPGGGAPPPTDGP